MPRRRWLGALLGAAAVLAAGLAWPWPAVDHAPVGSIRGAAASTIRIAPPAQVPWYRLADMSPAAAWSSVAASSEVAGRQDLTGGGHTLSVVGTAPTSWTPAGGACWSVAAMGAYNTGISAGAITAILVRFEGGLSDGSTSAVLISANDGSVAYEVVPARGPLGAHHYWQRGTALSAFVPGRIATGRMGWRGGEGWRDGVAETTLSGAVPALPVYIGGRNSAGTLTYPLHGCIRSAIVYTGAVPSAAGLAAVSAAMP